MGRAGSAIPTAFPPFPAGTEVSVDEIRSAAAFSEPYPPSLHAPLVGSSEPHLFFPNGNFEYCISLYFPVTLLNPPPFGRVLWSYKHLGHRLITSWFEGSFLKGREPNVCVGIQKWSLHFLFFLHFWVIKWWIRSMSLLVM